MKASQVRKGNSMTHSSSRWNHMQSIPMPEISENEISEAIHEFSEGCDSLEKLLLDCKANGVETSGCHFGHGSYLDIRPDSGQKKIAQMLAKTLKIPKTQILITPNAGNPFSGQDWYRATIGFQSQTNIAERDIYFFQELSKALKLEYSCSPILLETAKTLLELCNFLKDKESELNIRITHHYGESFAITLETWKTKLNVTYYKKLFNKVGLKPYTKENWPIVLWETYPITDEELYNKLSLFTQQLISKFSLPLPTEITEDMRFAAKAMVMRRKFGTEPTGIAKMNDWINSYRSREQSPVNYK